LISAVAAQTKRINLGSGSVLLNHYSPFKVAEVFCTLNELYPGRIDLGAGRATTGPVTDFALQQDRSKRFQADSNQQITELVSWLDNSFPENHPFSTKPIYTIDSKPNLYLLGSSAWSANAAAALGLRYVVAGFINQNAIEIANIYKDNFKPSKGLTGIKKPELILSIHVVCADTEEEAARQLAPVQLMYKNLASGDTSGRLPSPKDAVKELGGLPKLEQYKAGSKILPKFVGGTPDSVFPQLKAMQKDFGVEEIIIQDMMTDHKARLYSYELLGEMLK